MSDSPTPLTDEMLQSGVELARRVVQGFRMPASTMHADDLLNTSTAEILKGAYCDLIGHVKKGDAQTSAASEKALKKYDLVTNPDPAKALSELEVLTRVAAATLLRRIASDQSVIEFCRTVFAQKKGGDQIINHINAADELIKSYSSDAADLVTCTTDGETYYRPEGIAQLSNAKIANSRA